MTEKPAKGPRKKRPWWSVSTRFIVTLIVSLAVLFLLGSLGNPSSRLCNQEQYFDLHSGRHRVVWNVCYMPVSERVSEGFLARLYRKHFGEYPEPLWVKVNTFGLLGPKISPNHRYHGLYGAEYKLRRMLADVPADVGYERLLVAYFLWGAKLYGSEWGAYLSVHILEDRLTEGRGSYPLTEDQFPDDSKLKVVQSYFKGDTSLTPRGYGLERFPELMQKIPPPH